MAYKDEVIMNTTSTKNIYHAQSYNYKFFGVMEFFQDVETNQIEIEPNPSIYFHDKIYLHFLFTENVISHRFYNIFSMIE